MSRKPPYPAIDLGELAVDAINAVLGTELEPGRVRLSSQAHKHMAEDHPEDYHVCFAALVAAVSAPSFIGHAPKKTDNLELIKRVNHPDGKAVLVAISLEVDGNSEYRVRTSYLLAAETVDNRRRAGRLKPPPPSR